MVNTINCREGLCLRSIIFTTCDSAHIKDERNYLENARTVLAGSVRPANGSSRAARQGSRQQLMLSCVRDLSSSWLLLPSRTRSDALLSVTCLTLLFDRRLSAMLTPRSHGDLRCSVFRSFLYRMALPGVLMVRWRTRRHRRGASCWLRPQAFFRRSNSQTFVEETLVNDSGQRLILANVDEELCTALIHVNVRVYPPRVSHYVGRLSLQVISNTRVSARGRLLAHRHHWSRAVRHLEVDSCFVTTHVFEEYGCLDTIMFHVGLQMHSRLTSNTVRDRSR